MLWGILKRQTVCYWRAIICSEGEGRWVFWDFERDGDLQFALLLGILRFPITDNMKDLIPKGYLGWIWTIGILAMVVLVIYTLATDTSPFQSMGLDARWTTIIFAALIGLLLLLPMVFKRRP